MAEVDLLVLGDANPDLVLTGGDVAPAFGQAERLVDDARLVIGGSGAILACGAARLGLRVGLAAVVGDDLFGSFMRDELGSRGVDIRSLSTDLDRPTGVTVVLSRGNDRAILTSPGTIGSLRRSLIDPKLLLGARHVHVSSYFLQRALVPELPALFREVRANGATTSVDPNWDPSGRWDDGLLGLLRDVDVFLPNEMEALSIARISEVEEAMSCLLASDTGTVVVKAAGKGSIGARGNELVRVPPIATAVVDATGAGDAFDAGFLAAYLTDDPLHRCLALGNACGALSTLGVGGTGAQPTMDEALDAIERGSAA